MNFFIIKTATVLQAVNSNNPSKLDRSKQSYCVNVTYLSVKR